VVRSTNLDLGSLPSLIKLHEPNQLVAVGKNRVMTIESVAMEPRGKPMVFNDDAIAEVILDSGSDDRIATISAKGDSLRVWKTKTAEQVGRTISRPNMIRAALGFDGSRVVVCDAMRPDKGSNGAVTIYDVVQGKQIGKDLKVEGGAKAVVVSPDGRMILTLAGDGISRTWDASSGDPISPPVEDKSTVAADFAPTGACVASLGKELKLWDASNGEMQWTAEPSFSANHLAFSPLGSRLVVGGTIREDGMSCTAIQIFDTATGKPLTDVLRHDASAGTFGPSVGFGFNSDETRLVTHGSHGRSARVWDLRDDGRLLFEPLEHPRTVVSAAFLDPAGNTLVTACSDGLLRSWELIPKPETKAPPGPAKGPNGKPANSIVFLIDTTGSMAGSLKQIQDEVRRQIDLLPPESAINIVTFGEEPKFLSEWPVLVGSIGKTPAKDFVSALSVPSGYSGARNDHFAETFKRVLKMRPTDVWVMTDGDLVNARKRFTEAGEDANRAKVFLNTMLITAPARDELLAGADAEQARFIVWDMARMGTGFGYPAGVTVDESGKPLERPPEPRQLPAARREPRGAVYKPGKSVVYIIDRTAQLYLMNNLIPQEMARQLALLPKDAKVNIIMSGGKELVLLSDKLQPISSDVRSGFRDLIGARISSELAPNVDEAIKAAIEMKPEEIVVFSTGLPMKPTQLLTDLQPLVKQAGVRIVAVHSHYPMRNSKQIDDRVRPSSTPLWTLALESGGVCIVPGTGQVIKDPIAPSEPGREATHAP
jgi:WD40 repeat protein